MRKSLKTIENKYRFSKPVRVDKVLNKASFK